MKKIINGKMYNTETAKKLGWWSNGVSYSNFNRLEEALYLKKTGEYFIAADYYNGDDITPVTEAEAKCWAEEKLDADEYIAAFGEPEE